MDKLRAFLDYQLISFGDRSIEVGQMLGIVLTLLLGYVLVRWVGRILVRRMAARSVNADVVQLVGRIYMIIVIVVVIFMALEMLNVPLTAFAFISGAVAVGVGFGAQNIINNYISGWILLWERPIRIGDFLEIAGHMGSVEAINTRSTRIKRVDGVHMLVPNSHLLENTVVNWTLVDHFVRTQVRVGVAYGSPTREVETLIQQAIDEHTAILNEPAPLILFDNFGDNSLEFEVIFWVEAGRERDLRRVRSDLRYRLDELFRENSIVIAFPQRDVHIDSVSPLEIRMLKGRDNGDST